MNTAQLLQILEVYGINTAVSALTPPLAAVIVANPTWTDAQLTSQEDGTLKHYIRTKIGFFVDIIWGEVSPYLDQAITAAIPSARTLANVPEPAPVP